MIPQPIYSDAVCGTWCAGATFRLAERTGPYVLAGDEVCVAWSDLLDLVCWHYGIAAEINELGGRPDDRDG